MSQDEVISLTYRSPLRVNVGVSDYFFQVQVQLALEKFHRVYICNVFEKFKFSTSWYYYNFGTLYCPTPQARVMWSFSESSQ